MGTFTTGAVLREASLILKDEDHDRWSLPTLNTFLNAGVREIVLRKPNAAATPRVIALVAGTQQEIEPTSAYLIRALRNLNGPQVTPIERDRLDAFLPAWVDPQIVPYAATVRHVIYDVADPRRFMVYPGNDGTGILVVLVALAPEDLPDGDNPTNSATYTATPIVADEYRQALVDYVLHRAFSIDDNLPGMMARSDRHFARFVDALGLKLQGEIAANPDTAPRSGA